MGDKEDFYTQNKSIDKGNNSGYHSPKRHTGNALGVGGTRGSDRNRSIKHFNSVMADKEAQDFCHI